MSQRSGQCIGSKCTRLSPLAHPPLTRSERPGFLLPCLAVSTASTPIRTAQRVDRFTYAIRNIVVEAKKVEATGKKVRYLNIGDPNQFGFLTPPHLIEAVAKAMRDGHNGYTAVARHRRGARGGGRRLHARAASRRPPIAC